MTLTSEEFSRCKSSVNGRRVRPLRQNNPVGDISMLENTFIWNSPNLLIFRAPFIYRSLWGSAKYHPLPKAWVNRWTVRSTLKISQSHVCPIVWELHRKTQTQWTGYGTVGSQHTWERIAGLNSTRGGLAFFHSRLFGSVREWVVSYVTVYLIYVRGVERSG